MAVVQISKIQVRRGRKSSESGVPQLASGEMAWTVDTQELFIGNGSVAEGAPAVGNSKVLTEHDNLLDLIESYRYARPDPGITTSVFRTLQNKLDDYVNVKDFGATGDGLTDDTAAFQAAFDALFRNSNNEYRKRLYVPTGHYRIANTLRIPSYTLIDGESQIGCILSVGSSTIETTSSAGTALELFESSDRPQNLVITNTTFRFTTGHFDLSGLKDSSFVNCSFQGQYENLTQVAALNSGDPLVLFTNTEKIGTRVDNVTFDSCLFEGSYKAVGFDQEEDFESNIKFLNCKFIRLNKGIEITGSEGQSNRWYVYDSDFEEIADFAFKSDFGVGTKISRSRFINCGNDVNQAGNPETAIIIFGEEGNNVVEDCTFNRHAAAYNIVSINDERVAHPEVLNSAKAVISDQITKQLYNSASFTPLAMFSALNKKTVIDYTVNFSTTGSARSGAITIVIGDTLSNPILSDSYSSTCGDDQAELLEFSVSLADRSDSTTGSETMVLNYRNPAAGPTPDKMSYFVSYGV
jgi:hypothetical protein